MGNSDHGNTYTHTPLRAGGRVAIVSLRMSPTSLLHYGIHELLKPEQFIWQFKLERERVCVCVRER